MQDGRDRTTLAAHAAICHFVPPVIRLSQSQSDVLMLQVLFTNLLRRNKQNFELRAAVLNLCCLTKKTANETGSDAQTTETQTNLCTRLARRCRYRYRADAHRSCRASAAPTLGLGSAR